MKDKYLRPLIFILYAILVWAVLGCEEDRLVKLECVPGEKIVCDEHGQDFPNADPIDIAQRSGQCSYGLKTCTVRGWSECVGAKGPELEICDGIDNNCDGQADETCSFVWQNMGEQTTSIYTGCCSHQETRTEVCDASYLGREIRIKSGNNIQNINPVHGWSQGTSISLSANQSEADVTGWNGCGCDVVTTTTATVYECISQ